MTIEEYRRLQEELESMRETIHLLKSPKMGQRLLEARQRDHGMSLEQVRDVVVQIGPSIEEPHSIRRDEIYQD